MNFQQRKQYLLATLEQHGTVLVAEVARQLGTTPITIRRDLALLASKGLLERTHGGAVRPSVAQHPVAFASKSSVNAAQKEYICRLAAPHIAEGDVIFIDCGSTTFPLCALVRHLNIRVVTNSLPVLFELAGSAAQVVMAGGEVDARRQATHGAITTEQLRRYRVDKAFMGVDGLSLGRGLSAKSEKEAAIYRAVAASAGHVFLLCDSSKLEQDQYFQFAPLATVGTLVTDQHAPADTVARYREAALTVLT